MQASSLPILHMGYFKIRHMAYFEGEKGMFGFPSPWIGSGDYSLIPRYALHLAVYDNSRVFVSMG